jgi:hypothetical protein
MSKEEIFKTNVASDYKKMKITTVTQNKEQHRRPPKKKPTKTEFKAGSPGWFVSHVQSMAPVAKS